PSTQGRPPAGPNTQGSTQDNQNVSQNFAGIGSFSQNLSVTKGKKTKAKKTTKEKCVCFIFHFVCVRYVVDKYAGVG
ncbi:hypothetical protein MKW92_020818, partial [Papaver armeniacum]